MEDLRERIRRLSDLGRIPLINALIGIDAQEQARASGRDRRARLGSTARNRAEEARSNSNRLGQIIYFLRFRSPATNTSAADLALCDELAEKLKAKGQWDGEYSK